MIKRSNMLVNQSVVNDTLSFELHLCTYQPLNDIYIDIPLYHYITDFMYTREFMGFSFSLTSVLFVDNSKTQRKFPSVSIYITL